MTESILLSGHPPPPFIFHSASWQARCVTHKRGGEKTVFRKPVGSQSPPNYFRSTCTFFFVVVAARGWKMTGEGSQRGTFGSGSHLNCPALQYSLTESWEAKGEGGVRVKKPFCMAKFPMVIYCAFFARRVMCWGINLVPSITCLKGYSGMFWWWYVYATYCLGRTSNLINHTVTQPNLSLCVNACMFVCLY